MPSPRTLLTLCALCAAWLSLSACGPGPKPPQLINLERLRNAPEFSMVQQDAPGPIQRHDEFFKRSISAWQDGDNDLARGYADLAQLYYDSADFRAKIKKENKRREDASAQIEDLTRKVTQTKSLVDAAEARLAQLQQAQDAMNINATKGREAQELMVACDAAKASADALNASTHAAATYARADNTLKIAREQIQQQRNEDAIKLITEATTLFNTAANEAQPFADIATIYEEAQRDFRGDAFLGGKIVTISLPRLFDTKDARIDHERAFMVDRIAKLALKYPRTNIIIEGHTSSKGSTTKMRELSEERASAVQSALMGQGIPAARIITTAIGSERPRYDTKDKDERGKNDRVEITFAPGK